MRCSGSAPMQPIVSNLDRSHRQCMPASPPPCFPRRRRKSVLRAFFQSIPSRDAIMGEVRALEAVSVSGTLVLADRNRFGGRGARVAHYASAAHPRRRGPDLISPLPRVGTRTARRADFLGQGGHDSQQSCRRGLPSRCAQRSMRSGNANADCTTGCRASHENHGARPPSDAPAPAAPGLRPAAAALPSSAPIRRSSSARSSTSRVSSLRSSAGSPGARMRL